MRSVLSTVPLVGVLAYNVAAAPMIQDQKDAAPAKRQENAQVNSNNYSGAKLLSVPDGSTFNYITAQINIPQTQFVSAEGSPGEIQTSAAWVGFGGHDNGNAGIMQTGCSVYDDGQQDMYSRCWYEFYPAPPVFYDGFAPSEGDTMTLELYFNSPTDGTSVITNQNTGDQVQAEFSAPNGNSVQGNNALWIVEDPGAAQGKTNFVDFQTQYFDGCEAYTTAGNNYGPGDGSYNIFDEFKNLGDGNGPTQWTNSYLPSDSQVQVDWSGPS